MINFFANPLWLVLACIWGALFVATAIVLVLTRHKPDRMSDELVLRTKSWWWMIGIFTGAFLLENQMIVWLFAVISFLALKEFFSMIPSRRSDRRVLFWAYLSIPVQYYLITISWYGLFVIFIPVYLFLLIPARMVLSQQTEGFLKSVSMIQWGLMITVFAMSHAAYLYQLPAHALGGSGKALVLYLVLLVQFNDVAQYCWGKLFGKHFIVPKLSPKKTWEGLLGGVITTLVVAWMIAPLLTPFNAQFICISAVLISVTGFMGDITISAIKRDIGMKDTGNTIPGHGGILDRVDSLTYSAPLFFHMVRYFFY